MRNILKMIIIGTMAFGLVVTGAKDVSPHRATAAEKIDGKCSVTIDPEKNTSFEKAANGTGRCAKVVHGYYSSDSRNYLIDGTHSGTTTDGEKFTVLIMPGFYTYEVTVHALSLAKELKAPSVSSVGSSDKTVTGTTEPKLKVTVKAGRTAIGYTTSNNSGQYTVKLKKRQKAGTKLTISVKKGTSTKTRTVTVKYTAPVVKAVKSSSTAVKGTTVAYAKVTVKAGTKIVGTTAANRKGVYTVKIKKQKAGTKLTVTAKKGSLSSKTKTITVQ